MLDLRPHVRPGDGVWWSQAAEATPLVDALLDQVADIGPVRAFCGLSVIALRSTAGGRTAVVPRLDVPVTTARADVDVVVTEHGTAWLRGVPTADIGRRLIDVAAPEHRDDLHRALREGPTT